MPNSKVNRLRSSRLHLLPDSILALAVGIQLVLLVSGSFAPSVARLWQVRNEPALTRSASLSFGAEFSSYIRFLVHVIPDDALVVIPPMPNNQVLGHMGLMQYFLFPRRLTNCPSLDNWGECKLRYGGPGTYLIVIDGFPPKGEMLESKQYLAFDADHGVLVPDGSLP